MMKKMSLSLSLSLAFLTFSLLPLKASAHNDLCDLLAACSLTQMASNLTQAAGNSRSPLAAAALLTTGTAVSAVAVAILLDKDDAVKAQNDKKIADMGRSLEKVIEEQEKEKTQENASSSVGTL